jgi:hypothetical protein
MKASITDFKAQLATGGVRPTMFYVELNLPTNNFYVSSGKNGRDMDKFSFLCKASQLPGQTLTTVSVGLPGGGALKLPGSRLFEPWNTNVLVDGNFETRRMMEQWCESIIGYEHQRGAMVNDRYMGSATVHQLDRQGEKIRSYELRRLWPMTLSPIELSYEAQSVEDFDVQWNYHYFQPIQQRSSED